MSMTKSEKMKLNEVTLAALLHDIGKFAERAGMEVSQYYREENQTIYQPPENGGTCSNVSHALYTAAFIERFAEFLPKMDAPSSSNSGDSLINLAARHHNPETPLQMIVTEANHLANGLDSQLIEVDDLRNDIKNFRRTRLIPIAEELLRGENFYAHDTRDSYHFCFPLQKLAPAQIFPVHKAFAEPTDDETAAAEYVALFEHFIKSLPKLEMLTHQSLWLEHFESLYQVFSSSIPTATVGNVIPDVSLYDHSRVTAAMASAIFHYHTITDSMQEHAIQNRESKKFLLVSGDFHGIQEFIFSAGNSTNKAAAKLLRGRSFAVSLLSELASDLLCRELGLPVTSVLLSAAGKFTVLAANLDVSRDAVARAEKQINQWLVERHYGEVSIGFAMVEASGKDFEMQSGRFARLWSELGRAGDESKCYKFDLDRHSGVVSGYLGSFDNRFGICPFCGKRPGIPETRTDTLLKQMLGEKDAACSTCRDHIYLGIRLVKSKRLAVVYKDSTIQGNRLRDPLFEKYQITFDPKEAALTDLLDQSKLLRLWHIGRDEEEITAGVAVKFISGYVPTYQTSDKDDIYRLLHGEKNVKKTDELYAMIDEGGAKSFPHIAKSSLNPRADSVEKFTGTEALGFLKADVDNLGMIFSCGLPENRLNLSRIATFSRHMNSFFSLYLPYRFATETRYNDIYTIFAGGDDLFLVGPWNRIIDFAAELHREFNRFACCNPAITISAGISINKPGIPVPAQAEHAEAALDNAKLAGRDRLTMFGETVTWLEFDRLLEIRDLLQTWQEKGYVGKGLLYQLNEFQQMAKLEKNLRAPKRPITMEEMECLKWRSLFTYSATRNVGKTLEKVERKIAIDEVMIASAWLQDHAGTLKIALWQVLYNQR